MDPPAPERPADDDVAESERALSEPQAPNQADEAPEQLLELGLQAAVVPDARPLALEGTKIPSLGDGGIDASVPPLSSPGEQGTGVASPPPSAPAVEVPSAQPEAPPLETPLEGNLERAAASVDVPPPTPAEVVVAEARVAPIAPPTAPAPAVSAVVAEPALPQPTNFEPELGRAVLDRIRMSLHADLRTATLDLHPAELGRVQIQIAMREGSLTATFRAETPQTREILERQLPELRATLAAQGIDAEHIEVELGSSGFGERAHDEAQRQTARRAPARSLELTVAQPASAYPTSPLDSSGGIDTFA